MARHLIENTDLTPVSAIRDSTVVVQGFGNVGSVAAGFFREAGARIIAISDSAGGIYNEKGIDLDEAHGHKREHGQLSGLHESTSITNEELLQLDCDILVPAALGNQIHANNAHAVKANLIVEGANNPVSAQADRILTDEGIVVVPDILANNGGVTVSYFEWVQNTENQSWDVETVCAKMEHKITRATDKVVSKLQELSKRPGTEKPGLRCAALAVAVERLARVIDERGIWP